MWKKITGAALAVITLSVGTVYAEKSLQTVYHVYLESKPIGTVENKETVNTYIEDYIEKQEKEHENWDMTVKEDISYKSESVFSPINEEEKVKETLREDLTIAVEAVQLKVNDDIVAHLPTKQKAVKVIEQLKGSYVEPEVLKVIEKRDIENVEPELDEGETKVIDVRLSESFSFGEQTITPSQVNTVEEAVKRIKEGEKFDRPLSKEELIKSHSSMENIDMLDEDRDPLTDVIVTKQSFKTESLEHKVEVRNTDELYKGESKVIQEGENGKKEIFLQTVVKNGKKEEEKVLKENTVKDPVKKIILKGTKNFPSTGTGDFKWPAVGGTITSKQGERWGRFHKGIDIAGVKDRTIKAADHGKVIEAGYKKSFGNKVVINHKNGYKTIYAHLSSIDVSVGDTVKRGESIGVMGTTGRSTGVHLHFEIHKDGKLKNPLDYVSK